jgi:hypothetical protein
MISRNCSPDMGFISQSSSTRHGLGMTPGIQHPQGLGPVPRGEDEVAGILQEIGEALPDVRVVLDEEEGVATLRGGRHRRGPGGELSRI